MRDSRLHIVYATDSRYLFPTQVAAGSAIAWASRRGDVCIDILDCGVPDKEWNTFTRVLRDRLGNEFGLVRHRINMHRYDDYQSWHGSKGLYARLELPNILTDVEWCVYADGDTLFTDDPLKLLPLFDDKYALLGHEDIFDEKQMLWHKTHNLPFECKERVCSGFLAMNLNWFRDNDGVARLFKFIVDYPDVIFPDQDALNYVCLGKIGLLPDGWGKFSMTASPNCDKGCLHYVSLRPWEVMNMGWLSMTALTTIWFESIRKNLGMHPWSCPSLGFWRYHFCVVKTYFSYKVIRFLDGMPWLRGKYSLKLKRMWPKSAIKRFVG